MDTVELVLKVLSGAHRGAEARLAPGAILVGSGEDCDVLLFDDGVAGRHARFHVDGGGLRIEPVDGVVRQGGRALSGAAALPLLEVVSLGPVQVCAGRPGSAWPDPAPPVAAAGASDADRAPAGDAPADDGADPAEGVPAEGAVAGPPAEGGTTGAVASAAALSAAASVGPVAGTGRDDRPPTRRLRPAVLAVGMVLLAAAGFGVTQLARSGAPEPPAPDPRTLVEAVVRDAGAGLRARITEDGEGRLQVEGWIDTAQHRAALAERLRALPVSLKVVAVDQLAVSVRSALAGHGLDLPVEVAMDGTVRIDGVADSNGALTEAVAAMRRELSGLSGVDVRTVVVSEVIGDARARLRDAGLSGVAVAGDAKGLTLSGEVSSAEAERVAALAAGVAAAARDRIPVRTALTVNEALDLPLRSVVLGPRPFLILEGGRGYVEGEDLPNGFRILEIRSDALVLSDDGRRVEYPLNRKDP